MSHTRLSFKPSSRQVEFGGEAARQFKTWFTHNFVDKRVGRISHVDYRRAGAFDDHPGDDAWYANAYDRAVCDYLDPLTPDEEAYLFAPPLIACQLALGLTDIRALRCLRRGLTARVNSLQQKAYRKRYYAHDNARRRQLAAERRRLHRRRTLSPCPTPDAFRKAFAARNDSVTARLHFGGMVHDLECYVDNCLRINEKGEIVGRNGGIKHWLAENTPELFARYKTIMRYKALVKRLRQATGIEDPIPTAAIVDDEYGITKADDFHRKEKHTFHREAAKDFRYKAKGKAQGKQTDYIQGNIGQGGNENLMDAHKNYYAVKSHAECSRMSHSTVLKARGMIRKAFGECPNTMEAVFKRVDGMLME